MVDYIIWIWLGIFLLTLTVEIFTVEFVSVWFAIAAIPALIFSLIFPEIIWAQILIFFFIGFLLMAITRPILIKYLKKNIVSTNVDSFVGKTAIVTKEISENQRGYVIFQNDTWTAISSETIEVDTVVKILAIDGNKLVVTKS